MQYMLMCCIDEKAWTQLPDSEKGTGSCRSMAH